MSIKNIPTGVGDQINLQGVYTDGASRYNLQSLAALNYSMFGGASVPGAYQSIGFANAPDAVYIRRLLQSPTRSGTGYSYPGDVTFTTPIASQCSFTPLTSPKSKTART